MCWLHSRKLQQPFRGEQPDEVNVNRLRSSNEFTRMETAMITDTEPVNGLVALMAIFAGEGDWKLVEKGGELYVVPAEPAE